jgi:hypothetical protein
MSHVIEPSSFLQDGFEIVSVSVSHVELPGSEYCRCCRAPLPERRYDGDHMDGRDDVWVSESHRVSLTIEGEQQWTEYVDCDEPCAKMFLNVLGRVAA